MVEEIRSARSQHDASKLAFQRAKDDFNSAKRAFDSAKAEHERAQTQFKRAKAEFDQAVRAFKSRLEKVKAEGQKRREDKKSIAAKAGVPYQYHDGTVTVKVKSGYNRRTNTIATDVIVIDRAANPDEHLHVIFSEHDGTVLFSEWRKNH